ncbi:MAG TPA: alpha/beta hydrolase domain-containing protein [Bryobacteraceae bacterium]|nr:alpha/beta hydrolase domain-containing protein [Bryobacteraceae bacterium]
MRFRLRVLVLLVCPSFSLLVSGAVTSIDIQNRSAVLDGKQFGKAGAYERIEGIAHFSVDPNANVNQAIADIKLAPTGSTGKVSFSANFYILQPVNAAQSNGTTLVEVSNRGGKGLLGMFDFAHGSNDPRSAQQFGDDFLLRHGFTLVWIGWEFDVPQNRGLLKLNAPIATDHGKPITGLVRSEWMGNDKVITIPLGDRAQAGYPVADPHDEANTLYVRDKVDAPRTRVPRSAWQFSDPTHVTMAAGFDPGRIYEVVYRAKNPVVAGLGFASIRDFVSFFRHSTTQTQLGDESRRARRTIGFGISQDGRFLRTLLYYGFNADEQGRRVFDGVWAHVGGAGRGSFNRRFAQPSRDGHPFMNVFYPVDVPPYGVDALLEKEKQSNTVPKLFLTNGSYEYWGRCASLIHTTEDGSRDVAPPEGTRIYFFAGSQHGSGSIPPPHLPTQNTPDTVDYRPSMRALLIAMQNWMASNAAPPPSNIPLIQKDQLVPLAKLAFPHIPGVSVPQHMRKAYRLDFSVEPPVAGAPYATLVPQVNSDGNEIGGIHMPEVDVPLGAYTGWNLRSPSIGSPDEIYSMVGSFIPFPRTKQEGAKRHDSRLSIAERYSSESIFLDRITASAQSLVKQRLLLEEDVPRLRDRAAKEWDYVMAAN